MTSLPVGTSVPGELPEEVAGLELDLKDKSNPNSLVNILPPSMEKMLLSIPDEVLLLPDVRLEKLGNINLTEKRLRHSFWLEYGNAVLGKRKVRLGNIFNGVCRREQWYNDVVTDKFKMAYIMTPPMSYRVSMSELVELSIKGLREILDADHFEDTFQRDGDGKVVKDKAGNPIIIKKMNTTLANAKIKVADTVLNRVYGSATQKIKIDQRVLTKSLDVEQAPQTLEEIERKIMELEQQKTRKLIDVSESSKETSEDE